MADLSITAASVVPASNALIDRSGYCGETITAGMAVARHPTTNLWMKADANSATAELRQAAGIALNGGAVNQPVAVQTAGDVTIGATLTAGLAYYLSDTAGGICVVADIGSGEYVCLIGMAKSTTLFNLIFRYPNVAL